MEGRSARIQEHQAGAVRCGRPADSGAGGERIAERPSGPGHPGVDGRSGPAGIPGRGLEAIRLHYAAESTRARMTCSGSEAQAAQRRASRGATAANSCRSVPGSRC
jgi:hypothetical protein